MLTHGNTNHGTTNTKPFGRHDWQDGAEKWNNSSASSDSVANVDHSWVPTKNTLHRHFLRKKNLGDPQQRVYHPNDRAAYKQAGSENRNVHDYQRVSIRTAYTPEQKST